MSSSTPLFRGRLAGTVRRTVTFVVFVIAGLSFAFGFGNGWQLGLALGVPAWIAPLVAPAVDLSVVALLASVQLLRAYGMGGRLVGPRLLLVLCGGITLALNTASPILQGQPGRACFDAVAPVLLIGWSEVGPRLLGLLHSAVPDEQPAVLPSVVVRDEPEGGTDDDDAPLAELVTRARQLDAEYRAAHGRPITRDKLRAQLKVSNAVAGSVLREMRAASNES